MELTVRLGKVELKNPVTVASGTFGYGEEYADLVNVAGLGGFFTKAVTREPREGNPGPRIVETTAGMLNAIGLANVGVDVFIKEKLPFIKKCGTAVFVNVAGSTIEDYCYVVERLDEINDIAGLELNISCPNVKQGGIAFGSDPGNAEKLIKEIRKRTKKLLITKLSPNVTDITEIARAAVYAGSDALSLINTLIGMAVDTNTRKPKLANITGGLSGPAVKPVGVAMVWKVAQTVNVPLIGMGGIMSAEDALEYLIAGASVIQIGTGIFVDPGLPEKIINGLREYGEKHQINHISRITGSIKT